MLDGMVNGAVDEPWLDRVVDRPLDRNEDVELAGERGSHGGRVLTGEWRSMRSGRRGGGGARAGGRPTGSHALTARAGPRLLARHPRLEAINDDLKQADTRLFDGTSTPDGSRHGPRRRRARPSNPSVPCLSLDTAVSRRPPSPSCLAPSRLLPRPLSFLSVRRPGGRAQASDGSSHLIQPVLIVRALKRQGQATSAWVPRGVRWAS